MKTIQFTDEEIQSMILIGGTKTAFTKLKLAKKMPDGSTLSDDALLFYVTPSEAVEEVCDRRKAAREENEKRIAKQRIKELTIKCEGYESTIETLQVCANELREENEELKNEGSDGFNKFIDVSCRMSALEKDRDKYKKMYEDNRIV